MIEADYEGYVAAVIRLLLHERITPRARARAHARGGGRLNGARVDGLNGLVARLQRFETVRIAAAPDCQ